MKIQPGLGYIFDSSSQGFTLDTSGLDGQFPDNPGVGPYHPFQVTNLGLKPATSNYYFKVQPGLVNNLDPMIGGTSLFMTHMPVSDYLFVNYQWNFNGSTNYSYVVLQLGFDSANLRYPDDDVTHVSTSPSYPVVGSLTTMPVTGNVDSYIVLATAYKDPTTNEITVWQAVTKSLWTDRIKVTGSTARYYFASV